MASFAENICFVFYFVFVQLIAVPSPQKQRNKRARENETCRRTVADVPGCFHRSQLSQLKSNDPTSSSGPLLLYEPKKSTKDATELRDLPCLRARGSGCHRRRRVVGFRMGLKIAAMRKDEQPK